KRRCGGNTSAKYAACGPHIACATPGLPRTEASAIKTQCSAPTLQQNRKGKPRPASAAYKQTARLPPRAASARTTSTASHSAREERQAPAPAQEIFARQHGHQRERPGRQQIADGNAERRETAPEATMFGRRVLHEVDHCAAIFGAGPETLHDAHRDQQDRRPD